MKKITTAPKITSLFLMLAVILFLNGCQKDLSKAAPKTVEIEPGDPGSSSFIIVSDNVTETADGYRFNGNLSTRSDQGIEFKVGTGDFKIVTGPGGSVTSITGTGMVEFPKVGLFAEMLKTFAWKFIKAHVEYEKGSFYIAKYGTEIPLAPETRYLHYKVFDDTKEGFELANTLNKIIYKFNDLYIDPLDPSVFIKAQIYKPSEPKVPAPGNIVNGFWAGAKAKLAAIGGPAVNYVSGPQITVGFSNQAKFKSKPYAFKVGNADAFREKYGFNAFEEMPSHYYFKIAGIPIPSTGILRIKGDAYIHLPVKTMVPELDPGVSVKDNFTAALDWINNEEQNGYMATYTGVIDPGGKGIGAILSLLPNLNKLVGKDIIANNIDIDLLGGTLQYQVPGINQIGSGQVPSFLRFGVELKQPIIADIFGDNIKKYLISRPTVSNYLYFSLGPTADEMSFYTEAASRIVVPYFGELELGHGYFFVGKDGIDFRSARNLDLGPLHIEKEIKGKLSPEGFSLGVSIDKNITLPGDIELAAKRLDITIDSKTGIELKGDVVLPMGLGEAVIEGKLTTDELTLSGSLRAGTVIDLGNGLQLPTANMKFTFSSNPAKGFELEGNLQVPYVGMVSVKGKLKKGDFLLEGKASTAQISFGTVPLPFANSAISISKSGGVQFSALFNLGPFGTRSLEGSISATQIKLNGHFNGSVPVGGHNFSFANASVTADNNGVKISGQIDLYFYKMQVTGNFYAANNFSLTGQYNHNGTFVKTNLSVTVSPTKVTITGSGQVYGALGNQLYSGALRFEPDWANRTVNACYTVLGQDFCVSL